MACDTAFRIVAHRYLRDLTANHESTCMGDPEALHQMRVALTHLRTAILFFSPMVADTTRKRIRTELKWLNAYLGGVRDLDVAIARLKTIDKRRPQTLSSYRTWTTKRAESHRHLVRALRTVRYQRLIKSTSDWIEQGPWSVKKGSRATQERAVHIDTYSVRKLTRWEKKLLKKSRKLPKMDTEKRHRLRLLNKKICYSIETFSDLFYSKNFSRQQTALKYLRKAQKCLGRLNDDAQGHALAAELDHPWPIQFLSRKRERRLIETAATAYRKLATLG